MKDKTNVYIIDNAYAIHMQILSQCSLYFIPDDQ